MFILSLILLLFKYKLLTFLLLVEAIRNADARDGSRGASVFGRSTDRPVGPRRSARIAFANAARGAAPLLVFRR